MLLKDWVVLLTDLAANREGLTATPEGSVMTQEGSQTTLLGSSVPERVWTVAVVDALLPSGRRMVQVGNWLVPAG